MTVEQILQFEINDSKRWLDLETEETTYKRDLEKRIELNELIETINKTYSILEADKLHSELWILDWILYQVCINEK